MEIDIEVEIDRDDESIALNILCSVDPFVPSRMFESNDEGGCATIEHMKLILDTGEVVDWEGELTKEEEEIVKAKAIIRYEELADEEKIDDYEYEEKFNSVCPSEMECKWSWG